MAKEESGTRRSPLKNRFRWAPVKWSSSPPSPPSPPSLPSLPSSGLVAAPPWLPLPKIVLGAFSLNMLFIMIAAVVSGLVLGGTIQINAKAIGLTMSLVLFSSMFGIAYIAIHVFAARKAEFVYDAGVVRRIGQGQGQRRSTLHNNIVVIGRITIALWSIALLAVAITLATQPKSNAFSASSLGPLEANLAACIVNCLDMTVVALVVERTREPFVLPWVTPPMAEGRPSAAAKALIDDILGDGLAGHPYTGEADGDAATSRASSSDEDAAPLDPVTPKRKTRVTVKETTSGDDDPTVSTSTFGPPPSSLAEPFSFPSSGSTLIERQELWSRVDEGAGVYNKAMPSKPSKPSKPPPSFAPAASSFIPPVPSPPLATSPYGRPQFPPPQPTYVSPMASMPRPPLSRASASGFPRYAAASGPRPRPLHDAGRMHSYTAYVNSRQANNSAADDSSSTPYGGRTNGVRSVPPMGARAAPVRGKKLFDKAVEGLKATGYREEPSLWDDWSTIKIPGSFVEA